MADGMPPLLRPWPAQMVVEDAAAYCGFCGPGAVRAFRAAVKRGSYPKPIRRPGERQKWRKRELDLKIGGPGNVDASLPDPVFE